MAIFKINIQKPELFKKYLREDLEKDIRLTEWDNSYEIDSDNAQKFCTYLFTMYRTFLNKCEQEHRIIDQELLEYIPDICKQIEQISSMERSEYVYYKLVGIMDQEDLECLTDEICL